MSEFLPDRDRRPLEYRSRHAAEKRSAKWLVSCVIGGIVCGLVVTAGAAFALFAALSSGPHDTFDSMTTLMGVLGAMCVGVLILHVIMGKRLPPSERRQIKRYVILGFIIGCGVGCLIEGLCFSALKGI